MLESGERIETWVYEYIGGASESRRIAPGDWLARKGPDAALDARE